MCQYALLKPVTRVVLDCDWSDEMNSKQVMRLCGCPLERVHTRALPSVHYQIKSRTLVEDFADSAAPNRPRGPTTV